jgi:hypothetical protein
MPEWTKSQMKKFWADLPENEKKKIGSFKEYCAGVLSEDVGEQA